jgi:nitrile hydratase
MGGMHGFGRVEREDAEPVFHAAWEARVLGLSRACSARHLFNIDESRHAIERMAPADYLASSYYERWLDRNVRLLVEKGVITRDELEQRMAQPAALIRRRRTRTLSCARMLGVDRAYLPPARATAAVRPS